MKKYVVILIGACASLSAHAQSTNSASDSFLASTSFTTAAIVVAAPLVLLTVVLATVEDNDTPNAPVSTTTSTR